MSNFTRTTPTVSAGDDITAAIHNSIESDLANIEAIINDELGQTQFTLTFGESIDGTTTPQAVHVSDGTNGRTSGRVYKSDANDTTNDAIHFAGFVTDNVSSGNTGVVRNGIIGGFSGLTVCDYYYVDITSGAITNTNPAGSTTSEICVGKAISATQIDTLQRPSGNEFVSSASASGVTSGSTITVPKHARIAVISIFSPITSGGNYEQGDIILYKNSRTNVTFRGVGNVSTMVYVTASWSGSSISLSSSANMAGAATAHFYR